MNLQKAKVRKEIYLSLVSEWNNISDLLNIDNDDSINNIFQSLQKEFLNDTEKMMQWDLNSYLPDDILCKLFKVGSICCVQILQIHLMFIQN